MTLPDQVKKIESPDITCLKLREGQDIRKYYPLSDEAQAEYAVWRAKQVQRAPRKSASTRVRKSSQKGG